MRERSARARLAEWSQRGRVSTLRAIVIMICLFNLTDDSRHLVPGAPAFTHLHQAAAALLCYGAIILALWRPRWAAVLAMFALPVAAGTWASGECVVAWFVVAALASASGSVRSRTWAWLGSCMAVDIVVITMMWAGGLMSHQYYWWNLLALGFVVALGAGIGLLYAATRARSRETIALDAAREELRELERQAIARHLHDAIGHALAYMSLEVSVHSPSDDVEELRAALLRVQDSTEEAAQRLSELLGFLRDKESAAGWVPLLRDPEAAVQHGVEQLSACGWSVDCDIDKRAYAVEEPLRSVLGSAITESCANIVKHARPRGAVRITLQTRSGHVDLTVISPLETRTDSLPSTLLGLAGLRQRVEALGGSLQAGADAGSWVLRATMPMDAGLTQPVSPATPGNAYA